MDGEEAGSLGGRCSAGGRYGGRRKGCRGGGDGRKLAGDGGSGEGPETIITLIRNVLIHQSTSIITNS